ncbi:MAG: hypothetical protein Q8P41_26755 [Pseudomonadota bacterium]|nr:hypothetical protein [Pseudomonadota bacterium]
MAASLRQATGGGNLAGGGQLPLLRLLYADVVRAVVPEVGVAKIEERHHTPASQGASCAETVPLFLPADGAFDVGVDTRARVNGEDADCRVPFRVAGEFRSLPVKLGPLRATPD